MPAKRRRIPPCRRRSKSSMLSAPANIPATTQADFTAGFGDATLRCPASNRCRPATSASFSTGDRPAVDTRFGSSNMTPVMWDASTSEMPGTLTTTLRIGGSGLRPSPQLPERCREGPTRGRPWTPRSALASSSLERCRSRHLTRPRRRDGRDLSRQQRPGNDDRWPTWGRAVDDPDVEEPPHHRDAPVDGDVPTLAPRKPRDRCGEIPFDQM
jgi:hypothetical protein